MKNGKPAFLPVKLTWLLVLVCGLLVLGSFPKTAMALPDLKMKIRGNVTELPAVGAKIRIPRQEEVWFSFTARTTGDYVFVLEHTSANWASGIIFTRSQDGTLECVNASGTYLLDESPDCYRLACHMTAGKTVYLALIWDSERGKPKDTEGYISVEPYVSIHPCEPLSWLMAEDIKVTTSVDDDTLLVKAIVPIKKGEADVEDFMISLIGDKGTTITLGMNSACWPAYSYKGDKLLFEGELDLQTIAGGTETFRRAYIDNTRFFDGNIHQPYWINSRKDVYATGNLVDIPGLSFTVKYKKNISGSLVTGEAVTLKPRKKAYYYQFTAPEDGEYSFLVSGEDLENVILGLLDEDTRDINLYALEYHNPTVGENLDPDINLSLKKGDIRYFVINTGYYRDKQIIDSKSGEYDTVRTVIDSPCQIEIFKNDSNIMLSDIRYPDTICPGQDLTLVVDYQSEHGFGMPRIQYDIISGGETKTYTETGSVYSVGKGSGKAAVLLGIGDKTKTGDELRIRHIIQPDAYGKTTAFSAEENPKVKSVVVRVGTQQEALQSAPEGTGDCEITIPGNFTVQSGETLVIPAGRRVHFSGEVTLKGTLKVDGVLTIQSIDGKKTGKITGGGSVTVFGGSMTAAQAEKVSGEYRYDDVKKRTDTIRIDSKDYYWNLQEWRKAGVKTDLSELRSIKLEKKTFRFSGETIFPKVLFNDMDFGFDSDFFRVKYNRDNYLPGTGTVTVTGKRDFTGEITLEFTIQPLSITDKTATLSKDLYYYSGKACKPAVTIEGLKKGTDYSVSYKNNINIGKAAAIVKGKGVYGGTLTLPFQIKVKNGATYTKNGFLLVIKDAGKKTVSVRKYKKKQESVKIPNLIQIGGRNFKIVSIEKEAFAKNAALEELTIGLNISGIGPRAFADCEKLQKIHIRTTKLTSKTVEDSAFSGVPETAEVLVPSKKLKAYKKLLVKKGLPKGASIRTK